MEGEVFYVVGQFYHSDHKLDNWIDQQDKLGSVLAHGENPELNAVVELPAIDGLHSVLLHVVPDVSEVQAELSDKYKP